MNLYQFFTLFFAINLGALAVAAPRDWTEGKTGRKIKGELVDKKEDGSSVLIKLTTGKSVWIKTERLSPEDQKFISTWVKPFEYLKVVDERDQSKKVTGRHVVVTAKDEDIALIATPQGPSTGQISFIVHQVPAGESMEVELEPGKTYKVEVLTLQNKNLVTKMVEKIE